VKLYSAVSRKTVHFNQLDMRTGARVKQKRVDSETGEEVPWDQIVKGYELASGAYVTVSDDELAALDPKAVRTIEIEEFVDLSAIDPIFYDSAYYLVPDKASKPYALLARAMEEEGKVGIAHFVLRTKQYLAAIRPSDGRLLLSTMVYADEVNDPASIPELEEVVDVEISDKELAMAAQLVESLAADFEPDRFRDTYREAVLDLIGARGVGRRRQGGAHPTPHGPRRRRRGRRRRRRWADDVLLLEGTQHPSEGSRQEGGREEGGREEGPGQEGGDPPQVRLSTEIASAVR
jgi:DNA end-binding protein Ku